MLHAGSHMACMMEVMHASWLITLIVNDGYNQRLTSPTRHLMSRFWYLGADRLFASLNGTSMAMYSASMKHISLRVNSGRPARTINFAVKNLTAHVHHTSDGMHHAHTTPTASSIIVS